ncbi:unnamed protein product, partial [Thlaspi arvense]
MWHISRNVLVRCATRIGIWDGVDHEGISETTIEVKSYEVIEDGVIKHFSHEELKEKHAPVPYFLARFIVAWNVINFILHEKCAYLLKEKTDPFYKMPITLSLLGNPTNALRVFGTLIIIYNTVLDVRCGSISEIFFHESHPHHPLYIDSMGNEFCKACGDKITITLSCEESGYVLDPKCSILPKKIRVTNTGAKYARKN